VPGDKTASHAEVHQEVQDDAALPDTALVAPGVRPGRLASRRLPGRAARWLAIFAVWLGLLLIRFLVPTPVGQSDNRDGPRLMCGRGLGLNPVVPHGDPRFFRFIYFQYAPSPACGHSLPYPTSELVPLELARFLTPVFGLPGTLNLIALGVLMCVIASVGVASLATGLRMRLWAQLLVAAAAWLIIADAAFFDVFAGPFEEPAALTGLLLVAAGIVYLGRGWRATVFGLVLAGSGGFLAILSKEQYLPLAVPICLTLILASLHRSDGRRRDRFRTRQAAAAVAVAAVLAVLAGAYGAWDSRTAYGQRLHHIQVVDMVFQDIVNGHDNARADLQALGLPVSWAKYGGTFYWDIRSVRTSPLHQRYEARFSDGNIARFLLTHPGRMVSIGQQAAQQAQLFRVTALGDYPPDAGHPPGAIESRVAVVTWLVHRLPPRLGLLWLIPLWCVMAAVAILALRRRGRPWHRDGAMLVLCMTGCAIVAFVPPAYFAGISTSRHLVGMNLATALAFVLSVALAASMAAQRRAARRAGRAAPRERPARSARAALGNGRDAGRSWPASSPRCAAARRTRPARAPG
jgi:hypothetical protein